MPKGTVTQTDVLNAVFTQTTPSWVGSGLSNLYIALHTADPSAGNQSTSEVTVGAYTSYARTTVAKTSSAWTVSGATAQNASLIQAPQCTGGTGATITNVSIGTLTSGAGQILYCGTLTAPLAVSNLIQPQFAAGAIQVTEG